MSDLGNCLVFAENLRRLMKQRGVRSVDVANAIDISVGTYSNWINARMYPRIDRIEKLANYFNVSKSELVERTGIRSDSLTFLTANEKVAVEIMRDSTEEQQEQIIRMMRYAKELLDFEGGESREKIPS